MLMSARVKQRLFALLCFGAFEAAIVAATWFFERIAAYDACLDSINYDKSRWHLCDEAAP
jgi:hypothetical protein